MACIDGDICQFIVEEKDHKLVLVEVNEGRAQSESPAVNDLCRFCSKNLKKTGVISNSAPMFSRTKLQPQSVADRLAVLGLTCPDNVNRSTRMCRSCLNFVGRLERDLAMFRKWKEQEANREISTTPAPPEPSSRKRDRSASSCEPAPPQKKHRKHPPQPQPSRTSVTQVITTFPSKTFVKVPAESEAGIIQHIANQNWRTAANFLVTHKELFDEIKSNILVSINEQCQRLIKPNSGFMLFKTSPDDLKSFSFDNLILELERMAPFLLSIFTTISKHNPDAACAALCIALRGRYSQMAAFAYHINNIIARGGIKKAVFNKLCTMAITTSYGLAKAKQKEIRGARRNAAKEAQANGELSSEVSNNPEAEMDVKAEREELGTGDTDLKNPLAPIKETDLLTSQET